MGKHSILVVDDEKATAEFLAHVLRRENYLVTAVTSYEDALAALKGENRFAIVVSDIQLGHKEGTSLVEPIKAVDPNTQIIFLTGYGNMEGAVKAIHEGAFDYISKAYDLNDIEPDILKAVSRAGEQYDLSQRKAPAIPANNTPVKRTIIGKSPQMVRIYHAVAKASLTRESILITGESGTGKEMVAHAIHENGAWAQKPFVTVNCCALTETLLESELFGHVKGSFTGATQNKIGLFEAADGGTLFLDEIGDISPMLQVALLRALQEGEIKPVGSSETKKVDVRVIAATHRPLDRYVAEGKFREDLYYRLKVIPIEMPPLRDRQTDLPDLIEHFVRRYSQKLGKSIRKVSDEAMALLLEYSWPGNIRELENAIGRAMAMTNTSVLYPEDFPEEIVNKTSPAQAHDKNVAASPVAAEAPSEAAPESLEEVERRHILKTLESVNYNKSRAAAILGIDRVTLYRRAFRYGLLKKRGDDPVKSTG